MDPMLLKERYEAISGEVSALVEHPETRSSFVDGVLQVVTCSTNADTCAVLQKWSSPSDGQRIQASNLPLR